MSFDRLQDKIDKLQNPTVVGLDTALEHVPPHMLEKHISEKGETLEAAADAVYEFNIGIIDALCDIVPAVKPQSAFFEALGPAGVMALKKTFDYAKSKDMYVIFDGKRNDISSTAEAYSKAYLGTVKVGGTELFPFNVDALTVNAYLGSDGIKPFIETAVKHNKAMFALVKTSNMSAVELQDKYFMIDDRRIEAKDRRQRLFDRRQGVKDRRQHAAEMGRVTENNRQGNSDRREKTDRRQGVKDRRQGSDGLSVIPYVIVTKRLYTIVGELMEEISRHTIGSYGFTRIGAVIGATYPEELAFLRRNLRNTFFLVPGYGAQGGSAKSAAAAFNSNGRGAIVNSSRGIIAAWKKTENNGEDYMEAARAEALRMKEELREELGMRN